MRSITTIRSFLIIKSPHLMSLDFHFISNVAGGYDSGSSAPDFLDDKTLLFRTVGSVGNRSNSPQPVADPCRFGIVFQWHRLC
jgi:hypothetical protein